MTNECAVKILDIGNRLSGRIEQWRVDFALDYVTHNEPVLALETLCSYIVEDGVRLSRSEYGEIEDCARYFGAFFDASILTDLRILIDF